MLNGKTKWGVRGFKVDVDLKAMLDEHLGNYEKYSKRSMNSDSPTWAAVYADLASSEARIVAALISKIPSV